MKFSIIGITGQTGSVVASTLKQNGHEVRAIVRNEAAAQKAQALGYEAFITTVDDVKGLTQAFTGVDGAYLFNPPAYMDEDMFSRARTVHHALLEAVKASGIAHAVALSSVGGQHSHGTGNILTTYDFEQQIKQSGLANISILRAANFLDNWASSIPTVQEKGVLPSMFLPLDKKFPMVSSIDIGETIAQLLIQGAAAPRLVELHGPQAYSALDAAQTLSELLNKPVQAVEVPPDQIAGFLTSKGMPTVTANAFQEMLQGFNSEHIVFTGQGQTVMGRVNIEDALKGLL